MDEPQLSRIGTAPQSRWDVYSIGLPNLGAMPQQLALSSPKFVCLVHWGILNMPDPAVREFAQRLLNMGCVYFCCWGRDSEKVHDIIDEELVGDGSTEAEWLNIMTTWHRLSEMNETFDFFVGHACPDAMYINQCTSAVAIFVGNELENSVMEVTLAVRLLGSTPPPPSSMSQAVRFKKP